MCSLKRALQAVRRYWARHNLLFFQPDFGVINPVSGVIIWLFVWLSGFWCDYLVSGVIVRFLVSVSCDYPISGVIYPVSGMIIRFLAWLSGFGCDYPVSGVITLFLS